MTPTPDRPPLPYIPPWQDLKMFMLGAVWFIVPTLGPAGVLLWHNAVNYEDPIDWPAILKVAASGASMGLIAYWRKYKAMLSPPPGFDVKEVVTTVQTTEKPHVAPTVVTTIQETKLEPTKSTEPEK